MVRVVKIVFLLLVISACSTNKDYRPAEYSRYMENEQNDYVKKIVAGDVTYNVQLATPEYIVSKEFAERYNNLDTLAFNRRLRELDGYVLFLVKIHRKSSSKEALSAGDAAVKASYYQFEAQRDITLAYNGLTISPATYFFEDNYSLSPYNTIVAGFKCGLSSDLQLTFNDRYEQNPFIKVTFTKQELSQLPHLEIL